MATLWLRINAALLTIMLIVGIGIVALLGTRAYGGPLDPTNPPASTLPQVEPRVPIDHVPFTINAAGSYFLTRDVTGPANTGNGITIASDDVTLDLNGFSIVGTGADSSQGHGFGITVSSNPSHNIIIRNGVVRDWNYGVAGDNAHQSRIESVRAYNNKWDGIRGGTDTTIADSSSSSNNEYGIVSFGGTVQHCEVDGNNSSGIFATDNSVVKDNEVDRNNLVGIAVADNSVVKDNSVHNNLSNGIGVGSNADVEGNSVIESGGQGIVASGRYDVIKDNLVEGSATNGIDILNNSNVEGNTVVGNDTSSDSSKAGILVTGSGNTITANHSTGNTWADIKLTFGANVVIGNRIHFNIDDCACVNTIGPVANSLNISNPPPDANFQ